MVYTCTLSEELQERALNELNEDPKRRDEAIELVRDWIKKQPHLNINTDDKLILRFLRRCKFCVEETQKRIDYYYSTISRLPQWFSNRDPQDPNIRELLKLGILLPLKEPDVNGGYIFLFRQGAYNPKKYSIDNIMKSMTMFVNLFQEVNEIHQITGISLVLDMGGISFSHIMQFTPSILKNSLYLYQDGLAIYDTAWHVVNASTLFHTLFNVAKVFMKKELKEKLKNHGSNLEPFYKEIPKEILPKEYGGQKESIQDVIDYWVEMIDLRRDWFLSEQTPVDESKRPKS